MTFIEKLLSISSVGLGGRADTGDVPELAAYGHLGQDLLTLLPKDKSAFAFESALHIFPAASSGIEMALSQWNTFRLWRCEYGSLAENMLFFAEDAFGDQFCLNDARVCYFDAETAELRVLGYSLDEWARRILEDYEFLTGYPLMHAWQQAHGPLPDGTRLMPKVPFVLGGEYSLDNLYPLGSVSAMRSRGNLARQIKDLPDKTRIQFRIIE